MCFLLVTVVAQAAAGRNDSDAFAALCGEGLRFAGLLVLSDTPRPDAAGVLEGLADRVVPIPVVAARYGGMQAGKNCLLWYRMPVAGVLGDGRAGTEDKPQRPVLERYDLTRRKLEVIADPVSSFAVSGDGTRLVVRDRHTLRVLRTDRSGSATPEGSAVDGGTDEYDVDTRRIVVTVDQNRE